jgi:hypothetical protein
MSSLADCRGIPDYNVANASIVNNCTFPLYLTSVQAAESPQQTLWPAQRYTESYRYAYRSENDTDVAIGVSIKLSRNTGMAPLTQVEYTYDPRLNDTDLYYDVSSVDDAVPWQFQGYGLWLQPSSSECSSVVCRPGADRCYEGYINPFDDWATKTCRSSVAIVVTLCPSGLQSCG